MDRHCCCQSAVSNMQYIWSARYLALPWSKSPSARPVSAFNIANHLVPLDLLVIWIFEARLFNITYESWPDTDSVAYPVHRRCLRVECKGLGIRTNVVEHFMFDPLSVFEQLMPWLVQSFEALVSLAVWRNFSYAAWLLITELTSKVRHTEYLRQSRIIVSCWGLNPIICVRGLQYILRSAQAVGSSLDIQLWNARLLVLSDTTTELHKAPNVITACNSNLQSVEFIFHLL